PDDDFSAGTQRRVIGSAIGRVGGDGGCPSIGAGIVSPAAVNKQADVVVPAPDDHFTAGPHRPVKGSAIGRVTEAGRSPSVIGALWGGRCWSGRESSRAVFSARVQKVADAVSALDDH